MQKTYIIILLVMLFSINVSAQPENWNLGMGVDYQIAQHTNPYIFYGGDIQNPTDLKTFNNVK